jgi:valyl-tRNA synthetase
MLIANRFLTKLWNAAKFALMHLQDFDGKKPENLLPIDRWIIERERAVELKAAQYLNKYEIGMARGEIDEFFWKDFCDNYLEIVKDRLYKPEIHGEMERRSGQYALYTSLLGILRMYAIYVPHITEEIYQAYFRDIASCISIHKLEWIKGEEIDNTVIEFGEKIKDILREVRKNKSDRNLSLKEPLKRLEISAASGDLDFFMKTKNDLIACTTAAELSICEGNEFGFKIENE